jgi:S-(hydroxymethyl)glutathione dehydrogenase/alcohol dehydrogenase
MFDGTTRFLDQGKPVFHFSSLGCFSERTVVPHQCCVRVPTALPLEIAALIGCAVTTGVGAVLNTANVSRGSSVAVFGCGGVGLSVILGAVLAGCEKIIAVDRAVAKESVVRQLGATDFVGADEAVGRIKELTGGRGADYVFEAIGIPAVQEAAFHAVRPGGTLVLAGITPVGSQTNLSGAIMTREEKTVMGSYYGTSAPARDFPKLADLCLSGRLPIARMIGKRYDLDEINDAYADMLRGDAGRGVIVIS